MHNGQVAIALSRVCKVTCRAREEQLVERRTTIGLEAISLVVSQGGHGMLDCPAGKSLGAERFGPATRRVSELTGQEADDRVGHVEGPWVVGELVGICADCDEVKSEIADDLARRRDFDDVAEDAVCRGVHVFDLLEFLAEPEGNRLLAEVGELATWDLVRVDPPGRRWEAGLEWRVEPSHGLPVRLEVAERC